MPDARRRARTLLAAGLSCVLVPALLLLGSLVWDNRKYYLVSLLVLALGLAPLGLRFERRRPQARELVLLAVMTAIAVAGRAAFAALPECKPVAAVVILTAAAFGAEAGFVTGAASAFLSNFFFGQGPWTPWQMFGFGVIGFLAGVCFAPGRLPQRRWVLAVFGAVTVLVVYGGVLDAASLLMVSAEVTWPALLAAWGAGLPFNLVHAASTAAFLALGAPALLRKLSRVKVKHGILEPQRPNGP